MTTLEITQTLDSIDDRMCNALGITTRNEIGDVGEVDRMEMLALVHEMRALRNRIYIEEVAPTLAKARAMRDANGTPKNGTHDRTAVSLCTVVSTPKPTPAVEPCDPVTGIPKSWHLSI